MSETQRLISGYEEAMAALNGARGEPSADIIDHALSQVKAAAPLSSIAKAKEITLRFLTLPSADELHSIFTDYIAAVKSGQPQLFREMALFLLLCDTTIPLGRHLLRRAALNGDWIAAFLILREATRGNVIAPNEEIQALCQKLSPAVPFRESLVRALQNKPFAYTANTKVAFTSAQCLEALEVNFTSTTAPQHQLSNSPKVLCFSGVLTPLECDYLIAISTGLMQASKVVDASQADSINANYRTSDGGVILPAHFDLPFISILRKLTNIAGIAPSKGEMVSLLRYRPGQEYKPHHDYLEIDDHDYSKVQQCGQRKATLLTYLNTGFEGGETCFPELNLKHKGSTGDCLYFHNLDQSNNPAPKSLHAGQPVTSGEKWLATLWIREKTFWPWLREQ